MKPVVLVLIVLVSFFGFLLVMAPAPIIWLFIAGDVEASAPTLQVSGVKGSFWRGEATLASDVLTTSTLTWKVSAPSLLLGKVAATVQVRATGLELDGHVTRSVSRWLIEDVHGKASADFINNISHRHGLRFEGNLTIVDLHADANDEWLEALNGHIEWAGGRARFLAADGEQVINLPALKAALSLEDGNAQLNAHHDGQPVLSVVLKPTGWVAVDVRKRLLDLARFNWPGDQQPDESVLLIEEKML